MKGKDLKFHSGIVIGFWAIVGVIGATSLAAQSVSITSASPNPVAPGQTLIVTLELTSGTYGSPTGCVLTLVPYGQGNVKSIVSNSVPPLQARIAIPENLPLGAYGLEVNCKQITEPVPQLGPGENISKMIGAGPTNVVVGGAPSITTYGPSSASSGQTVTLTGNTFGQTQGSSFIHLVGSGVPDVYITTTTSWSNTSIGFALPEYASPGAYSFQVETPYGTSRAISGFTVTPGFTGWVDLHSHPLSNLGFGGKLIYGSVDNNGSLFVLGTPANVLGVVAPGSPCPRNRVQSENDALSDEMSVRGPGGLTLGTNPCGDSLRTTVTGILESELNAQVWNPLTYPSSGYPNFPTWPAWNDLVNQKMYYTWIKRSFLGGQRVLVALAVNSKLLADMTSGPGDGPDDDKASGDLQINEIKSFVNRHSDFMQIAFNSSDIPTIIAQNKLAVVLGVELDNIGDLEGNQSGNTISAEVDRLYGEGVRYIFPIHLVDNPIGGSATYVDLFNVANEYEEGGSGYPLGCATPSDGITYAYTPPSALITAGAFVKLGTNTPGIPPAFPCNNGQQGNVNTMGLTAAGQQAIQEMMNNHMLIDIDHMSEAAANMTISLAEAHKPYPYPLNSGHNGVRSSGGSAKSSERALTAANYAEIGKLHGMAGVGSAQLTADQWLASYQKVVQAMGQPTGAGFGTDMNGMEFAMPPRPGSNVQYGSGTMSGCSAVPLLAISREGNASWNYNSVGVAHYGLLPDFLQDVASMSGGCTVVKNMNAGAYYFYETWRIAEGNASAVAPAPSSAPAPPPTPSACPGTQVLSATIYGENLFNAATPCVCSAKLALNADGTCPTTSSSTTTTTPTGNPNTGYSCPSECRYGCSAQRICNLPPKQAQDNNTHNP